jgi:hypothetical protein
MNVGAGYLVQEPCFEAVSTHLYEGRAPRREPPAHGCGGCAPLGMNLPMGEAREAS